jgi:uncharacterized protein
MEDNDQEIVENGSINPLFDDKIDQKVEGQPIMSEDSLNESLIIQSYNNQVDISTLPKLEKIQFEKLQEDYLYVGFINTVIIGLIALIFVAMVGFFSETIRPYVLFGYLAVILFFAFMMYAEYRSFKNSGYALRDEDLFFKSGWIWTSMIAIPYKRIQHLEVTQGPISRLFDLANVSVYTAGGSSSDMEIEGIKQDEAESIKAFVLQKNKQVKIENSEDAI